MDYFSTIILGVVEGLTEFLPISSTAHLIIAERLMHIEKNDFLLLFNIVVQSGAMLAVVVYAPKRLLLNRKTQMAIVLSFIPTAVLGLLFKDVVSYLHSFIWVSISALFFGGIIMLFLEQRMRILEGKSIEELSTKQLFSIGTIQALSFIPGVSRSATTIYAGLFSGLSRKEAVSFSFFLGLPTMAAATVLSILTYKGPLLVETWGALLFGTLAAFLAALSVMHILIRYVEKRGFSFFAWYRIALSIVLTLLFVPFFPGGIL